MMKTTRFSLSLLWALCLAVPSLAFAEDGWKLVFEETFKEPKWPERWALIGSVGPTDKNALRTAGGELGAWLKRDFKAPAVRVEYTAAMEAKNAAGKIGDLSCMMGRGPGEGEAPTCYLLFGGEFNTANRISCPGMEPVSGRGPLIELGKTHRVVAEVNGRVATLTVDGKQAAQGLLPKELPRHYVGLYAWCGTAVFKSVKVFTKDRADPIPAELLAGSAPKPDPPQELPPYREWSVPPVAEVKASPVERGRIAITVSNSAPYTGPWPITMGVPFPRDTLWDANAVRLLDEKGEDVALQAKVAATWTKGGAIRWLHLDFISELLPKQASRYVLEFGSQVRRAATPNPIRITQDEQSVTVDTGALKLAVSKKRGGAIECAWHDANGNGQHEDAEQILGTSEAEAYSITSDGKRFTTVLDDSQYSVEVESAGPVRAVIRARGWYQGEDGERACHFIRRLYLYRGHPFVRLFHTWIVTVDTDKFKFRDLGIRFPLGLAKPCVALMGHAGGLDPKLAPPVVMAQTGRRRGVVRSGERKAETQDSAGWLDLSDGKRGATLCVYDMAAQWPNALEAKENEIVFHAFSNECGHDLDFSFEFLKKYWGEDYENFEAKRGSYPPFKERILSACGLAKTHEMILRFHGPEDAAKTKAFAAAAQSRPVPFADPKWVCDSDATGPMHPHDPKQFPAFEEGMSKNFDQFLEVLDMLTPVYGLYDYGMGIPHYIFRRAGKDGQAEYGYTGYRREYDLGYGNPIVPWKLFLRSGDARYYRYGIAFSRHCMDAHAHHWTNPRLKKQIGWTIADHGSWVYDTVHAEYTFNNWMEYLLLDYYVNGYERAMDVAVQFMDALHEDAVKGGRVPHYCGAAGVWHGNAALMVSALWEDKFRDVYEALEKMQTGAWCSKCGGFAVYPGAHKPEEHGSTHRQGWREYGVYHGTRVPGHDPSLDEALARMGETDLRVAGWGSRPSYATSGHMHWAAWQRTKDPRYLKFAQLRMKDGVPSLIGYAGLAPLRAYLTWMKLSTMGEAEDVKVPVTTWVGRFEVTPVFVKHVRGKETSLITRAKISMTGPNEADVTARFVRRDEVFRESVLSIPADAADGLYRIGPAAPSRSQWTPFTSISFRHSPDLKFMLGIPEGIEGGQIRLFLPAGSKGMRVLVPGRRKIALEFADGEKLEGVGPAWEAKWQPTERSRLALLKQEPGDSGFFKIQGVPAYAAISEEAAFEIDTGLRDVAPPEPSDPETAFVQGAFAGAETGKALLLNGRDSLSIPLGEKKSATRRDRFEAAQGTLEFFVRLNTHSSLLGAEGLPIQVPLDVTVPRKQHWMQNLLQFDWKSTVMISDGATALNFANFGRWSHVGSPDRLSAGRWYHFAVVWNLDDKGKFLKRAFLNGEPDPMGVYSARNWWPPALKSVLAGPEMRVGSLPGMRVKTFDFVLDELRVSDKIRYEYDKPFAPPKEPFVPDEHTLLLFHFDGDTVGVSAREAKPIGGKFVNR